MRSVSTASNTPQQQAPASLDQVEIFRPGKRRAMNGQVYEITAADVVACAQAYDPALHEAPHVVGHPRTDDPAYGWVAGLQAVDGGASLVITQSSQVEPAFGELVTSGRYPKRSACFYPPDHEANPKPGVWYLKHVGWLGAQPPAVKGLRAVAAHAASNDGVVEFGEWEDQIEVGIFRRLREWFIARFGVEEADRVLPSYELDALQREALAPEPDDDEPSSPTTTGFAEGAPAVPNPTDQAAALTARAAELDAREASIKQREDAQASLVKSARTAAITQFAETIISEGRWLPADKARMVAFMEALPSEATVVEFAEGDPTKRTERSALEVFQEQARKAPKVVHFGEHAGAARTGDSTVDFADPQSIADAAVAYQAEQAKAGRDIGIDVAVAHITRNNKEQ